MYQARRKILPLASADHVGRIWTEQADWPAETMSLTGKATGWDRQDTLWFVFSDA
jgi:hypothetical protein